MLKCLNRRNLFENLDNRKRPEAKVRLYLVLEDRVGLYPQGFQQNLEMADSSSARR